MRRVGVPVGMAVVMVLAVAACHGGVDDPAAVTADEQRQLNAAAATLDSAVGSVEDVATNDDDDEQDVPDGLAGDNADAP